MDINEKCRLLNDIGWTCDPDGRIYNARNGKLCTPGKSGYVRIDTTIDKKRISIFGHHFIYFKYKGNLPKLESNGIQIDHIDGNKGNNNPLNLRLVTHHENMLNKVNTKGYTKDGSKYRAQITNNKKKYYIGVYNTKEEAHIAYKLFKETLTTKYDFKI